MRIDDIFTPESIEEDFKKWVGAVGAGALALSPLAAGHLVKKDTMEHSIAQSTAILAQTMWGEARNHGTKGMLAVGWVIKNRAQAGKGLTFGHGIQGVALKNKQFSCWNEGDPNKDRMEDMKAISRILQTKQAPDGKPFAEWYEAFKLSDDAKEYQRWVESFTLAKQIMAGVVQDPTEGALFYHTTSVQPKWSIGASPISRVANHVFYRKVN